MDKLFISAGELLADSFRLAAKIHGDGFRPDMIAGIWRGGTPVAIAVQEFFAFRGLETAHLPIKTSSYSGIDRRTRSVAVSGLPELAQKLRPDSSLLIVDDVFDTGHSVETVLSELEVAMDGKVPRTIRIASPWYKPLRNRTSLAPHYFLHETDRWLVFPHELVGLSAAEIRAGKSDLKDVLDALEPS